jgi:hypothetical protein
MSSEQCHHTQAEMYEDHIGTKVVDDKVRIRDRSTVLSSRSFKVATARAAPSTVDVLHTFSQNAVFHASIQH